MSPVWMHNNAQAKRQGDHLVVDHMSVLGPNCPGSPFIYITTLEPLFYQNYDPILKNLVYNLQMIRGICKSHKPQM